ncbi:MAG: class I SAM-dependent methyltransferase [Candidatus Omnitrophica bacterium]|nr:class I SAM-dependent methyltransferase [Candidatus Omnitrophota bacterium]
MITQDVRCNLCNADDYTVLYNSTVGDIPPGTEDYKSTVNKYGLFHRLVSCRRCGLIYMNPRDTGIKDFYRKVVDKEYIESWDERAVTFRRHLEILRRYKAQKANLLDIGCYAGIFLSEAKKEDYNIIAIEPSKWAAEFAREKTGVRVLEGSWDEASLPENYFDVVTMWDIVEHLENPSACFRQICRWLKEGGIVAMTTHNVKGWFARLAGRRYPWLMRFHLYHFEPKTLSAMLFKNGFTPILVKNYTKIFSLKYILGRLGIRAGGGLFKKITLSFNTGDMFMIIARKTAKNENNIN